MIATTRTERDGFTYVSSCTYQTDPATVADVKVGDVVRVTDVLGPAWSRAVEPYTFTVESVDRDEFGVYLNQREGLTITGQYGNTICHRIEIIERA